MKITKTKIEGLLIIEPTVYSDNRGWFMETWSWIELKNLSININFVQDNHSFTSKEGTLRGIHYQQYPFTQTKLVRVIRGKVLDVAVDLRKNSPTFKQWLSIELSEQNKKQLLIPKGFGHGFITLTDNVEFVYKCDNPYSKEHERVLRFDDPELCIDWGNDNPIISDKDREGQTFLNSDCDF